MHRERLIGIVSLALILLLVLPACAMPSPQIEPQVPVGPSNGQSGPAPDLGGVDLSASDDQTGAFSPQPAEPAPFAMTA